MTGNKTYNVLFLCTSNCARSIMAGVLMRYWGKGRFQAFSAGSHPRGEVHPLALATIRLLGLPTEGLRSKSWDEFAGPDAPQMDFVFAVCDQVAGEECPVWPGHPITAHWGIPDPAAIEGAPEERARAFWRALREIENRIRLFQSLPLKELDRMSIKQHLDEIGRRQ
ncbi:MAG: arsenate reductase ArsC [Candidatus Binataceae bacterium]